MPQSPDIRKVYADDTHWYRKIWTLDIQDMAWIEQTNAQVNFLCDILRLDGHERILDLACGCGRHAIELARRGCQVVGVDITPAYITEAQKLAREQGVAAEFICADVREVRCREEFDVVLNLADGAIGYLENEQENLKIFDVIAAALKLNGKHVMDVCHAGYAAAHFPKRHWLFGKHSLSLADFEWDSQRSYMLYGGLEFKYGEVFTKPEVIHSNPTRLYTLQELATIFQVRGMAIQQAVSDFDQTIPASDNTFQIQVYSQKVQRVHV